MCRTTLSSPHMSCCSPTAQPFMLTQARYAEAETGAACVHTSVAPNCVDGHKIDQNLKLACPDAA